MTPLRSGWDVQSGCKVQADGAAISTVEFKPEGWIAATVPSTVFAAQIAAGEVKDPDYGINLRSAPGMTTKTPVPQTGRVARMRNTIREPRIRSGVTTLTLRSSDSENSLIEAPTESPS